MESFPNIFIEPNGRRHNLGLWGHSPFALETIRERGWSDDAKDSKKYESDYLVSRGWVKLSSVGSSICGPMRPTKAAINAVLDVYLEIHDPKIGAWLESHHAI